MDIPAKATDITKRAMNLLRSEYPSDRVLGAEVLGDIGRSESKDIQKTIKQTLKSLADSDQNRHVRRIAERSIRELNGELDDKWEKYRPQEPIGSLRDQYYLKRG